LHERDTHLAKIVMKGSFIIVTCGSCLTKFRLDESKISKKRTKVRCSRCQHIFLFMPSLVTKEEMREDVESFAQCHEASTDPGQEKMHVLPAPATKTIEKAAQDEDSLSSKKEIIVEKVEEKVPEKVVGEERIKVKTFKIGMNSFGIEWNIQN